MAKIKKAKIDDLVPDDHNMNKGTEFGQSLVEKSVRKFGAGRSILIDKNNRIIAGNKFTENAGAVGLEDVVIVETTGTEIVAVKRTDIDLDTSEGREMALADNATAMADIEIDKEETEIIVEKYEIDPSEWGVDIEDKPEDEEGEDEGGSGDATPSLVVKGDHAKLMLLYSELSDRGFDVNLKE